MIYKWRDRDKRQIKRRMGLEDRRKLYRLHPDVYVSIQLIILYRQHNE
jgi:hypothetical protein